MGRDNHAINDAAPFRTLQKSHSWLMVSDICLHLLNYTEYLGIAGWWIKWYFLGMAFHHPPSIGCVYFAMFAFPPMADCQKAIVASEQLCNFTLMLLPHWLLTTNLQWTTALDVEKRNMDISTILYLFIYVNNHMYTINVFRRTCDCGYAFIVLLPPCVICYM